MYPCIRKYEGILRVTIRSTPLILLMPSLHDATCSPWSPPSFYVAPNTFSAIRVALRVGGEMGGGWGGGGMRDGG